MPNGLADSLTRGEFVDLVRFLSELGKPGPFSTFLPAPNRRGERPWSGPVVSGGRPADPQGAPSNPDLLTLRHDKILEALTSSAFAREVHRFAASPSALAGTSFESP
jgi:hypothetical protein